MSEQPEDWRISIAEDRADMSRDHNNDPEAPRGWDEPKYDR